MRLRVLVFDDSLAVRTLIEDVLARRDYEVLSYSDPSECPLTEAHACRCGANQSCADILISDMDMPKVPGLQFFAAQMRKGCRITNVALMSGDWDEADARTARQFGCRLFQKPIDLRELNAWLDECEKSVAPYRQLSGWFLERDPSRAP